MPQNATHKGGHHVEGRNKHGNEPSAHKAAGKATHSVQNEKEMLSSKESGKSGKK